MKSSKGKRAIFLAEFSVNFGKKIKTFFFQDEYLNLKGVERKKRLEEELSFMQERLEQTEEIKTAKQQEGESIFPKFANKLRTHFWNIHQFFCDLMIKKLQSELRSIREFNFEEFEMLRKRISAEVEDSKNFDLFHLCFAKWRCLENPRTNHLTPEESLLLEAGRERILQLEKYIEKMREEFNRKKQEYQEHIQGLEVKLLDDVQSNYIKDLVFKYLLAKTDEVSAAIFEVTFRQPKNG